MKSTVLRQRFAVGLATVLTAVALPVALAAPAQAADPTTVPCSTTGTTCIVTQEPDASGCNGVRPTPGSENTDKVLVGGTLEPGGTAEFLITYPVDPTDTDGRTTFVITDCVFVNDTAILKYSITYVPNTAFALLDFTLDIPSDVPLGSTYCNDAKTTAAPSASQASNRKAGPACFVVGGNVRVEKHDAVTGDLLAGATFEVSCTPTTALPPTVINFLGATDAETTSYTNSGGPLAIDVTDVATTGVITINGPSGTPCTVTETVAPAGYDLPNEPTQTFTIDAGEVQTLTFNDQPQVGSLVIKKTSDAAGTFDFTVDCDGTAFDVGSANPIEIVLTDAGTATSDPITDIPLGTSCTVTELTNNDFTADHTTVTHIINDSTAATVFAFTNTRKLGSLVISKTSDAAGTFDFLVDCDGTAFDTDPETPIELVLTEPGTVTSDPITGIPTGTSCTVTELPNSDFNANHTSVGPLTITSTTTATVFAFTNTRKVGSLTITKDSDTPGTFVFDVSCDNGLTTTVTITVPAAGEPVDSTPITGIPTGTTCTVSEEKQPGFFAQPDQTVTIVEGSNTLTFTNIGKVRGLALVKAVDLHDAVPGDVLTYSFTASTSGNASQKNVVVTDVVPDGVTYVDGSATCEAPCTASYDAATNTVTWSLGDLAANVTVSGLTYQATVDPTDTDLKIRNTGTIRSSQVGEVESNEVITRVTAVLPEHQTRHHHPTPVVDHGTTEPAELPMTGAPIPLLTVVEIGLALAVAGAGFQTAGDRRRRRRYRARHAA